MAHDEVQETVSVPADSDKLAMAVEKLVEDVMAAKASGATGVALVTDAVSAAIQDLGGALPAAGGIGTEVAEAPIGVAEAFSLAGFKLARKLSGK